MVKKLLVSIGLLVLITSTVYAAAPPVSWSLPSIKTSLGIGEKKAILVNLTSQTKLQNVSKFGRYQNFNHF